MFFLLGDPCKQCHCFFWWGSTRSYTDCLSGRHVANLVAVHSGFVGIKAENHEIGGLVICQIQLFASYYFPSQYQSVVEGKRHHLQNKRWCLWSLLHYYWEGGAIQTIIFESICHIIFVFLLRVVPVAQ